MGGRILLALSSGRWNQGPFSSMQLGDQASGRHLTLLYRAFCMGAPVGAAHVNRPHPPIPTCVLRRQNYPNPLPRLSAPRANADEQDLQNYRKEKMGMEATVQHLSF